MDLKLPISLAQSDPVHRTTFVINISPKHDYAIDSRVNKREVTRSAGRPEQLALVLMTPTGDKSLSSTPPCP